LNCVSFVILGAEAVANNQSLGGLLPERPGYSEVNHGPECAAPPASYCFLLSVERVTGINYVMSHFLVSWDISVRANASQKGKGNGACRSQDERT
jgi:hypothetical protein